MIEVIVNGDDFGFAPAINEGIALAHRQGCLTNASLSVCSPATEQAAQLAGELPSLGVGLHLTLVEESPVSPPETVPSLVTPTGAFHPTSAAFAACWLTGRIRPADLRRETRAQLARARGLGIALTHLDSNDHLHLLPGVFELVVEEMKRAGLRRIRLPRERGRAVRGGWARRLGRGGLNLLCARAARVARQQGLAFPDAFRGFQEAGRVDAAVLLSWIADLRDGVTEFCLHPAVGAAPPRADLADWGYHWDRELAATLDPRVRNALREKEVALGRYDALPAESGFLTTAP